MRKTCSFSFAVSFKIQIYRLKILFNFMVNFKKPARKLSLRKRFLALTSNEAVYVRSLDKRLSKLLTGLKQLRLSKQRKSEGLSLAKAIAEEIIEVMIEPAFELHKQPSLRNSINSFSESECWNFFETKKEDLYRLKVNLKINVFWRMDQYYQVKKHCYEDCMSWFLVQISMRSLQYLEKTRQSNREHSSTLLIIFTIILCI